MSLVVAADVIRDAVQERQRLWKKNVELEERNRELEVEVLTLYRKYQYYDPSCEGLICSKIVGDNTTILLAVTSYEVKIPPELWEWTCKNERHLGELISEYPGADLASFGFVKDYHGYTLRCAWVMPTNRICARNTH